MTPVLVGQLLGIAFACGLNLYATIAALGILSRVGLIESLPPGLMGLENLIVIGGAAALYLIEAVVDKVRHANSLWDTVHTFIRPPAAALLAIGALWEMPSEVKVGAAAFAFVVALAAHMTKAGFRLALNTGNRPGGHAWISFGEDVVAVAFAFTALQYPSAALIAGGLVLALVLLVGPRLWRAFALGMRCLTAAVRGFFGTPRWREIHELPRVLRGLLEDTPVGAAPPRAVRAGVLGLRGVGAYRNGWLVIAAGRSVFLYRTLLGSRRVDLPPPRRAELQPGLWADLVHFHTGDHAFTLYLLKDGPRPDSALAELHALAI